MDRAYSLLNIKAVNEDERVIEGVATHVETDRVGDVVIPRGAKYKLPLVMLFQHDHSKPIGHVTSARVTSEGINITAKVAKIPDPGPLQDAVNYAWSAIKNGLTRGLSIGFRAIKSAHIETGMRFDEWEWLELSTVSVPAHQNATITAVKAFDREIRQRRPQLLKVVRKREPARRESALSKDIRHALRAVTDEEFLRLNAEIMKRHGLGR